MYNSQNYPLDATAVLADEFDDEDEIACAPGHYDYLAEKEQRLLTQAMKNERRPRRMRAHF